MKPIAILSLMILGSAIYAANAAEFRYSDYSDIDVVSVMPRSPDVKPFVMATLTKEQRERFAVAALKKNASKEDRNSGR
ncbi:MAG TPA: hypothetical protein VNW15_15030 [Rhizomicrobium sp.]|jgi:hypothetical protein|nr:hypothetical protein [Rhizomicrobium sp.]